MAARYEPCRNGLHVVGEDAEDEAVTTVASFPLPAARARSLFEAAKADLGTMDRDVELVVDLMVDGDLVDTFGLRRQMLARFAAFCGARSSS